jgi:ElaB/YqjD/DUF883 family membrane-anchored ribosome-binding protein
MGQSADELRQDIEVTRGELGETLDAIGDRVSPGRMIERRKNRVFEGLRDIRDRVMGSASDVQSTVSEGTAGAVDTLRGAPEVLRGQTQGNPLAAGAIAFGIGVLAASVFPASEREKQAADQLMDKVEPLKDELTQTGQDIAEHMKEPALEAMEHVKETATEGKQAVTDTAKEAVGTAQETAREAADAVRTEASGDQVDRPN